MNSKVLQALLFAASMTQALELSGMAKADTCEKGYYNKCYKNKHCGCYKDKYSKYCKYKTRDLIAMGEYEKIWASSVAIDPLFAPIP